MLIVKTSDTIKIKIDDLIFKVKPLTFSEKNEISQSMIKASQGDMEAAMQAVRVSLAIAIKDVKGLKYQDGEELREYQLEMEDNRLKDSCIDDLLNLPISNKISSICSALLQGVPNKILDNDGNPIEGIEIVGNKLGK